MNEKKAFGVILTVLGIVGLILFAWQFINTTSASGKNLKVLIVYAVLGAIFFFAGIGLIRTTRDRLP